MQKDHLKTNKPNEYSVKQSDTRKHNKIIAFSNASNNQLETQAHTLTHTPHTHI